MPFITYSLTVNANSSGVAQKLTDEITGGAIYAVIVTGSNMSVNSDFSVYTSQGRIPIWVEENIGAFTRRLYPTAEATDTAGLGIDWDTSVSPSIKRRVPIPISDERVEVNVTGAGASTQCTMKIIVEEDEDRAT